MRASISVSSLVTAALLSTPASSQTPGAQDPGFARPHPVLRELVPGMPKADVQEIRVMTASFQPGQKTVFHTHRFPVTVYILEGTFTLELEGRPPLALKAGEAMIEPPNVKMTGYNRSSTEPLRLVIFYVSTPETPFLDVVAPPPGGSGN